jgi:hypothetical protein
MEANMNHTRFIAVVFVVVAAVFVAEWFASKPADAVAADNPLADTGNAKPFEYFPSQFVMKPGEPTGEIPTF